jgi:hypothetical protein
LNLKCKIYEGNKKKEQKEKYINGPREPYSAQQRKEPVAHLAKSRNGMPNPFFLTDTGTHLSADPVISLLQPFLPPVTKPEQ